MIYIAVVLVQFVYMHAYLVSETGMMVPVPDVSSPTPNQVTKVSSKERGHSYSSYSYCYRSRNHN